MKDNLYLYPNMVKVRKERMTQAELALQIGISQQEVSRYESGEVRAPISYLTDLANVCEVSVDYILGRGAAKSDLSKDEAHIVEMYSALNDDNKIRAQERISALLDMQNGSDKN